MSKARDKLSDKWVNNASAIILLGKVGEIQLLSRLAKTAVVPGTAVPLMAPIYQKRGGDDLFGLRFCRQISPVVVHRRLRPAVCIPSERHDRQGGSSIPSKITLEIRCKPVLTFCV